MGFKFRWLVTFERTDSEEESTTTHYLIRWAVIGLAVIGLTAIAVWKLAT